MSNLTLEKEAALEIEKIQWRPHQGPQTKFHENGCYDTMFGGAKGPGKTESLVRESTRQKHLANYRGIIIRRTFPRLGEIIDRSHKYFKGMGAVYSNTDIQLKLPAWTFPGGAKVAFGHMHLERDKYNYQGKEFHFIGADQIEEFTETQILFMLAQNRTSDPNIKCYFRSTSNPGGVGHGWVKRRYIDSMLPNTPTWFKRVDDEDVACSRKDPKALSRCFIPATVHDNPSIILNDPNYIKRLEQLPEDDRKALLEGNWDVFAGQYFSKFRNSIHVVRRTVEPAFLKFLSLDYGYTNPSSVGWWMVDYDGWIHRYRELYKEGLTYTALAEEVMKLTPKEEKMDYCTADPSIWGDRSHHKDSTRGESGAETMQDIWKNFTALVKADNSRIVGWGRMREMIEPFEVDGKMVAKFTVSPDCKNWIRTVPNLIHDEKKVEDIDTTGEDHAGDDSRYGVMSRPEKPVLKEKMPYEVAAEKGFDPFQLPDMIPPETDVGEVEE